jgi:serine kinase of HPr protein (carbohydrate metabolism regulator)
MRCQIADLIVEVPEAGGMAPRCQAYLTNSSKSADIVVRRQDYEDLALYGFDEALCAYMESGLLFYMQLLQYNGLMFHASAIAYAGKAYLFSGPSGVGKSTHTGFIKEAFGEKVLIINDDKPALRYVDGCWYVYGTPWSGKDGINQNIKVPLAGICFLKQGMQNHIRRLTAAEAVPQMFMQTNFPLKKKENMHRLLSAIEALVQQIPIYELENLPVQAAAQLSMETMRRGAEEAGL